MLRRAIQQEENPLEHSSQPRQSTLPPLFPGAGHTPRLVSSLTSTRANPTHSRFVGYLDPASERTNLVVLTGFQATKIEFSGTTATGVTFAATPAGASYTVSAAQEVILAAGVIGTPREALLSSSPIRSD